ncbi:MAG: hypothetical protein JSV47_02195 [Deltaproteobacteria bacterium]|nr:MAG: hypothetical protein JSV47_02195 [Deltaproteobacteria bacterium]
MKDNIWWSGGFRLSQERGYQTVVGKRASDPKWHQGHFSILGVRIRLDSFISSNMASSLFFDFGLTVEISPSMLTFAKISYEMARRLTKSRLAAVAVSRVVPILDERHATVE